MTKGGAFEKHFLNGVPTIETGDDFLIARIPQNTSHYHYSGFFDSLAEKIRGHENLLTIELALSFMHGMPTEQEWAGVMDVLSRCSCLTTCKVTFYRYLFKNPVEKFYREGHYGYRIPSFLFPKLFEALDACPDFTTFELGAYGTLSSCAMPENFLYRDEIDVLLSAMSRSVYVGVFILDGNLLGKMEDATIALFSEKLKLCGDKVHCIVKSPKHYEFKSPEPFYKNVQKCDVIKSVCFRNSELGSLNRNDYKKMFEMLAQCRHLECIDIKENGLSEEVIEAICEAVQDIRVVGASIYSLRDF